jgi:hypothetical protein
MSTDVLHLDLAPTATRRVSLMPRLLRAEVLKLRRRRGLVALSFLLTIVPIVIGYAVTVGVHLSNAKENGPAGGLENLSGPIELVSIIAGVAAILIGVTAGAGDLNAGVFRELVVTGRSRRALFLARVPAGLVLLLPLVLAAYGVAVACSFIFADNLATPGLSDVLGIGGWLVLSVSLSYFMALGISSLVGSRSASIAGLLAWNMAIAPLLIGASFLGPVREGLLNYATYRISPDALAVNADDSVNGSLPVAILVIAAWAIVPLALGAWRTCTRDA